MLLKSFWSIFKSELHAVLPSKMTVEHEIVIEEGAKPPHHPLYHLSPVELKAAKKYVDDSLVKKKDAPTLIILRCAVFICDKNRVNYVASLTIVDSTKLQNKTIPRYNGVMRCLTKSEEPGYSQGSTLRLVFTRLKSSLKWWKRGHSTQNTVNLGIR